MLRDIQKINKEETIQTKEKLNKQKNKKRKRLRIAQLAPLAKRVPPKLYGGIERCVYYLTEELVRRGHSVTLFASNESLTSAKLVSNGPELNKTGSPDSYSKSRYNWLLNQVRQNASNFDIIHDHFDFHLSELHQIFLENLNKSSLIITVHGLMSWAPSLSYEFNDFPLISISFDQRHHHGGHPNFIANIYHGIPSNLYKFVKNSKAGEDKYLAFLGRISPSKRPDMAIEIAVKANIRLKIAASTFVESSNEYQNKINKMVEQNKDKIEFVGEINDKQKNEFLGNALALIFPINWAEPFGMVIIESMACGTPVIARSIGSVPEVIDEGISGLLFKTIDQGVLAVNAANKLNRSLVRQTFEKRFTVEKMVDNYEDVYYKSLKKIKEKKIK
ncbi:Glycos_transf_1 domain-containing protein [Meloidogyne graminicola]|uniref:Glycos_transf_1 domain-containing protein n=1 Tax=Meloidogyne graminicola TaxID=189291 RepID=A0A8S9ZK57_9BILA|nr:Glycos_transf_1 domain-containing protein [Meloidogyne graminicola]